MHLLAAFERLHSRVRANKWLRYFAIFLRIVLAIGFLPSGYVKIAGERFTALSSLHPLGNYLEALHRTGFYYTFLGIGQVTAAVLLLIPRTATLGALLYFPIILNICVLVLSVRFEGALISTPLMVLACLYLLLWDYHKFKWALPFYYSQTDLPVTDRKFPTLFFTGVAAVMVTVAGTIILLHSVLLVPRNTSRDCKTQCEDSRDPKACADFCDCVHKQGRPLNECLKKYNEALRDKTEER